MIALWASKGGSGTSVVATLIATALHRSGTRPMIIDLGGDIPAILGTTTNFTAGFGEWLSTGTADTVALARLAQDAGVVDLVGSGRLTELVKSTRLLDLDDATIVDVGTVMKGSLRSSIVQGAQRSYLVTRPCYLAIRRASEISFRPTGIIVVNEPGRSLSAGDIEDVLQAPVVASLDWDPSIARAVDAGRLGHKSFRIPRSIEKFATSLLTNEVRRAG